MDTNNWRPTQGAESTMDTNDWRAQLLPESRPRIVNKIMDTLKRHLPVSGEDGLLELRKIAQQFEEKVYTAATSQSDYLWKISVKMLTMETKSQGTMANSRPSNPELCATFTVLRTPIRLSSSITLFVIVYHNGSVSSYIYSNS